MMKDKAVKVDGYYQLPLPLRDKSYVFPITEFKHSRDNRENLFEKGCAAPATPEATKDQTWYLPNFRVYHPQQPNKFIVVLDCSASHHGTSLNKQLLQET